MRARQTGAAPGWAGQPRRVCSSGPMAALCSPRSSLHLPSRHHMSRLPGATCAASHSRQSSCTASQPGTACVQLHNSAICTWVQHAFSSTEHTPCTLTACRLLVGCTCCDPCGCRILSRGRHPGSGFVGERSASQAAAGLHLLRGLQGQRVLAVGVVGCGGEQAAGLQELQVICTPWHSDDGALSNLCVDMCTPPCSRLCPI